MKAYKKIVLIGQFFLYFALFLSNPAYAVVLCEAHHPFEQYTITPLASIGGVITPNTPQTVECGSFLFFKAYPDKDYSVDQWLVDGKVAQLTGDKFNLIQISDNHEVKVTFAKKPLITFVAAGDYSEDRSKPLLAVSEDSGITWLEANITNLEPNVATSFNAVSCTRDVNALCIAVGNVTYHDGSGSEPLLVVSRDGAKTWQVINNNDFGLPKHATLHHISCTGDSSDATCTAVGEQLTENNRSFPLLVISRDSGRTWQIKNLALPIDNIFYKSSCTGRGSTAICIAVGGSVGFYETPILVTSRDGGATWEQKQFPETYQGTFQAASCSGRGNEAHCVASGGADSYRPALLAVSNDGAKTWQMKNALVNGVLNALNCSGKDKEIVCSAAEKNAPQKLIVSQNGGENWQIAESVESYYFQEISCTGSDESAICAAIGNQRGAITIHGTRDWASFSIYPDVDSDFSFKSVSCLGKRAAKAFCIAGGVDANDFPFIARSDNWEQWHKFDMNLVNTGVIRAISGFIRN